MICEKDALETFYFEHKGQGKKVIHLSAIWKGFIIRVIMPNMKSLAIQKLQTKLQLITEG